MMIYLINVYKTFYHAAHHHHICSINFLNLFTIYFREYINTHQQFIIIQMNLNYYDFFYTCWYIYIKSVGAWAQFFYLYSHLRGAQQQCARTEV